jgi:hypothetical protein
MLPALSLLCSDAPAAKSSMSNNKRSNSSKRRQNHPLLFRVFVVSATLVAILPFLLVSTHLSPVVDMTTLLDKNGGVTGSKVKVMDSVPRTAHDASTKRHSSNQNQNAGAIVFPATHEEKGSETITGNCALCFFGLPRSFKLLVLPSIVKNVLLPNMVNQCDVYFHYYHVARESGGGRSGHGGRIDPNSITQGLRQAVHDLYYADTRNSDGIPVPPHVSITNDTDESFWNARRTLVEKYRTAKDAEGRYLYFPWMAKTFKYPTSMDNIVKQWHSIDAVWNDMEETGKQLGRNYTRVAMLRNDVMYVTPFDIYRRDCSTLPYSPSTASSWDRHNQYAIVPNWARFPINDRMIYGPHEAVKIWATQRFRLLEEHVVTYPEPGYGMHSERFLEHSIFPAIRNVSGVSVTANPDVCFFRARADGSVWNGDCATRDGAAKGFRYRKDIRQLVESISGGSCEEGKLGKVPLLLCHEQDENGKWQNLTTVSTQRV